MMFRIRQQSNEQPDLNITSMVDMMAVLTMYLLAIFATTDPSVRPLSDITLPASSSLTSVPRSALKVTVSSTTMRLDNELVTTLRAGQLESDDIDGERRVVPLLYALERERGRMEGSVHMQGDKEPTKSDTIAIEASHGLPYAAVDRVVRTARSAGFTKFQLNVSREQ